MRQINLLTPVEGLELSFCHVHRWANDASREEVPTLSNSVLLAQAADQRCAWQPAAILQGTGLPGGVFAPTDASGVFARPRPKRHDQTKISLQQIHSTTYQEMARIAANGGDHSGSHPAWDPV
jgi:hypothetical protein